MVKRLASLVRLLTRRRDFEDGMGEELRFHIEQYTDELVRSGVSPAEAARRARIEFGTLNSVKGECREAVGLHLFDEFARELKYAARLLRKSPGFTATALLTLAVCLGANLMIFAVIDSILLRPLPFHQSGRLVTVFNTYPKAGVDRDGSSITNYYERRGHIKAFESLAIYHPGTATIGEPGATKREQVLRVSPEFLTTLGIAPAMGRSFTDGETSFETDSVAILTDGYWRQRYDADPAAIGKQIRADGLPKTIVGVLPADFTFLSSEACLLLPLASRAEDRGPSRRHSGGNVTQMIARLRPGSSVEQAQSQIDSQNATLEKDDPQAKMMADAGFRSLVVPLQADHVANVRPTLLLLQAGVLVLLLIGTVNLVNLLLIRASGRVKELAVRQALGASRPFVVSEVIVETTLLTVAGGLLGLAVGAGGVRLLMTLGADRLPLGSRIALDGRLALIGMAASVVMGIILAAPIAWFNLRGGLANALQSESRGGTTGRAVQVLRHGFVVSQIALAFMLLSGAGLLGLSLKRAMAISPGFRPDHVLTGQVALPWKAYPDNAARLSFAERLVDKVSHLPGVVSAGVVSNVLFSGRTGKSAATVKGHVLRAGESPRGHYSYWVTGDYFETLGFSLRGGRFLTADDARRGQRVCVVDEDFARYYWPDGNAIGQRLFEGSEEGKDTDAFTVVGLVGSVKQAGLTDDAAQGAIYYPYAFNDDQLFVAVRTGLSPKDERINDSLAAQRSPALLAVFFSAIALLLTAVGSYGVLSYAVAQRQREIGVRMALGARPEQIRSQFFNYGLRLLLGGSVVGLFGAWLAGRAMQSVLFHVPALSWPILAATAGVVGVVCLIACLVPSDRAARVSPMEALAGE